METGLSLFKGQTDNDCPAANMGGRCTTTPLKNKTVMTLQIFWGWLYEIVF
jgi:hypothetical protein